MGKRRLRCHAPARDAGCPLRNQKQAENRSPSFEAGGFPGKSALRDPIHRALVITPASRLRSPLPVACTSCQSNPKTSLPSSRVGLFGTRSRTRTRDQGTIRRAGTPTNIGPIDNPASTRARHDSEFGRRICSGQPVAQRRPVFTLMIMNYPLPDHETGQRYSPFTYLYTDSPRNFCGTVHNVASPEMPPSSSGEWPVRLGPSTAAPANCARVRAELAGLTGLPPSLEPLDSLHELQDPRS